MATSGAPLSQLEDWLNVNLGKKAPQLPPNAKEGLVKFYPWIAIIIGILSISAGLAIFGLGVGVSMMGAYGAAVRPSLVSVFGFSSLLLIASGVLNFLAYPGLTKKSIKGWRYVFYAELLWIFADILRFDLGQILGALIGLYLLFQIRSYYK